jgi:hypothetical protein
MQGTEAGRDGGELPRWLWLWFPPLLVVMMVVVGATDPTTFASWFKRKEGPIEWATFLVLLPAIAAGIYVWRRRATLPTRWLGRWMALVGIGAFYYAGEEISWGQQIWHWSTPEFLAEINDQQETNFHNLEGFGIFEELPRNALEQWILWGGIVVPLVAYFRGRTFGSESWQRWFVPTLCCLPTAILAIVIRLPDRLDRVTGKQLAWLRDVRVSEPQEYYFALFLMMYLLSVAVRLRQRG